MNENNVIYGDTCIGLILVLEPRLQEVLTAFQALVTSNTWGDFRSSVSKEMYETYLVRSNHYHGPYGDRGEDLTPHYFPDDTPFNPNDVFDVYNPESFYHPEIEMTSWVPEEIQEKYGRHTRYHAMDMNVPRGKVLEFDIERMDEIIAALEEQGYSCRSDEEQLAVSLGPAFNFDDYTDRPEEEET